MHLFHHQEGISSAGEVKKLNLLTFHLHILHPGSVDFQPENKKRTTEADEYARSLMEGKTSWRHVPVISDLIYLLSIISWKLTVWKPHQRYLKFKTHPENCNQCGICADLCPTGNIIMDNYPVTGNQCNYCLRCVSFCPTGSITCFFNYNGKTYRAVKAKDLLE